MIRRVFGTCLCMLNLGTGSLGAQRRAPELAATSCPEANGVLGPPTSAQRKSRLLGWHSSNADRSVIRVESGALGSTGIGASITWVGRPATATPSAQLEVSVPVAVFATPLGPRDTLSLLVDDTLRFELGVPTAPTFRGTRLPRFAPVQVPLSHGNLVALARASRAVVLFQKARIPASKSQLAAVNALFRVFACNVALPER